MITPAHLYRLTSPSGKVYIGIAINVNKRWAEHNRAARVGSNCAIHKAIRKYGFDNFSKEVLLVSDFEYVKDLESKAIAAFGTMVPDGYNLTAGGDGTIGYRHTEASKRSMSATQKGRTLNAAHVEALSKAHTGYKMPDAQKLKIGDASRGKVRTVEWRESISKAKKGIPQTEEAKRVRAETQRKKWQDPVYKARQLELQRLGSLKKQHAA